MRHGLIEGTHNVICFSRPAQPRRKAGARSASLHTPLSTAVGSGVRPVIVVGAGKATKSDGDDRVLTRLNAALDAMIDEVAAKRVGRGKGQGKDDGYVRFGLNVVARSTRAAPSYFGHACPCPPSPSLCIEFNAMQRLSEYFLDMYTQSVSTTAVLVNRTVGKR